MEKQVKGFRSGWKEYFFELQTVAKSKDNKTKNERSNSIDK